MNFGNLKYYSRYSVPDGFRDVLSDLVKEVLRDQPEDIVHYCAEYFKAKEEGIQSLFLLIFQRFNTSY